MVLENLNGSSTATAEPDSGYEDLIRKQLAQWRDADRRRQLRVVNEEKATEGNGLAVSE